MGIRKTFKMVILNIPKDKEKEIIDELIFPLIKKGIIDISDIHTKDDE